MCENFCHDKGETIGKHQNKRTSCDFRLRIYYFSTKIQHNCESKKYWKSKKNSRCDDKCEITCRYGKKEYTSTNNP